MDQPTALSPELLRLDGGTQMRERLDDATIDDYAAHLLDGAVFPPVIVFYDGAEYWLADGFHRVWAYRKTWIHSIACQVLSGTRVDAIKYALHANATNGRARSSSDLTRAYRVAVENALCAADDVSAVKGLLQCTQRWAEILTKDARDQAKAEQAKKMQQGAEAGKTQREIAAELGVDHKTVGNTLKKLGEKTNSSLFPQGPETPDQQPEPDAPIPEQRTQEEIEWDAAIAERYDRAMTGLIAAKLKIAEQKLTVDPVYDWLNKDHPFAISMHRHTPLTTLIDQAHRLAETERDFPPIPGYLRDDTLKRLEALTRFYSTIEVLQ